MEIGKETKLTKCINAHTYMNPKLFIETLKSHIYSYLNLPNKEPIEYIIAVDTYTEEDFERKFEKKSKKKLINIKNSSKERFKSYDKYLKGTKEYDERKVKKLDKFREYKKENDIIIDNFKSEFKKINPNIKINVVRTTKNFGCLSPMRNIHIMLCNTPKMTFHDFDDQVIMEADKLILDEINNSNQCRKGILNKGENVLNPKVISMSKINSKVSWDRIYDTQELRKNSVKFVKGIGSEDGFFRAFIRQAKIKEGYAFNATDGSTVYRYSPSDSTILDDEKKFESVLQILYYLKKHNIKTYVWNESYDKVVPDYNNFFQLFNSGYACDGYGFLFSSSSNKSYSINLNTESYEGECRDNIERSLAYVIFSLILYPEVLEDGKEKDYFIKVNEILKNKHNDLKILDILKATEGYDEVFENIKKNFEQPDLFDEYMKNFNLYMEEKIEVFEKVLQSQNKNKDPHLTGDTSNISFVFDFKDFFSANNLKNNRTEDERVELMNKLLNGKFLPEEFYKLNQNEQEYLENNKTDRIKFVVQYLFDFVEEKDREFILKTMQQTKKYCEVGQFVNECFEGKEISSLRVYHKEISIQNIQDQSSTQENELNCEADELSTTINRLQESELNGDLQQMIDDKKIFDSDVLSEYCENNFF